MSNLLLYLVVIFSWGTSWLAIKYQLGDVHPYVSVAYRFLLAGGILLSYCLIRGKNLKFSLNQHARIALQALFMFSTNYVLIYLSSQYLSSGLESIVFSTLTFMNIINARIFLKTKASSETISATFIGFIGILIIFKEEFFGASTSTLVLTGLVLGLLSAYSASIGNIVSASNQKQSIPVIESTAFGMLYGGLFTLVLALATGQDLVLPTKMSYWIALGHLSIFASILAFVSYLTLLGRIGPSRAGYCVLVFPIIAVTLSVFFEDYTIHTSDIIGLVLILAGNYTVMFKPNIRAKVPKCPTPAARTVS